MGVLSLGGSMDAPGGTGEGQRFCAIAATPAAAGAAAATTVTAAEPSGAMLQLK
jgi:hypothetical protein